MLLGANTSWHDIDHAFEVELTDGSRTVTARVSLDDSGAPRDFNTMDRFAALATGLVQARWSTPIEAWYDSNDRPVPITASAIWHLPAGPFSYIDGHFLPGSILYNVGPPRLSV